MPGFEGRRAAEAVCRGDPMPARERESLLAQAVLYLANRKALDSFVADHAQQPAMVRRAACLFDLGTRARGQTAEETSYVQDLRQGLSLEPVPFFPDQKPAWEADLLSVHWGFTSAFDTNRLRRFMHGEKTY